LALRYTAVLIIPYPDHEENKLMFLSEWLKFFRCLAFQGKLGVSSRLDVGENERVHNMLPSFSFLVGLKTYQYRGIWRWVVNVS